VAQSSRARARSWPYPYHRNFEKHLRKVAAAWFEEQGFTVSKRYRYILADRDNWAQNIILPEVATYIEKIQRQRAAAGQGFALHKYIHHGLSSQAMIFNLVGSLVVRDDLEPLQEAFSAQGINWPTGKLNAQFEYEDRDIFHEDMGQPTSIDLVLQDAEGRPRLFIEAKLVEKEFGGCSVFARGDCDGRNPLGNLDRCYLHYLGRKYWVLLEKHRFLNGIVGQNATCILTTYYQFFREILFALELDGTFVLLFDTRNPTFRCGERGLMPFLREMAPKPLRSRVKTVTLQCVVEAIKASGRHEWVAEFERKYGLFPNPKGN
jgi:hypothetical protein